ncbi:ceramide glucosyltransferase [Melanaphis sacchari]|uniref:ceramide glucosyltransferase n=1 Tax=Melanaphis sacchari TaxID=742174 RepID=UPI000DC145FF|nr:ceramide glucosyltransferase [Melanaphis sacchari]XP_025196067.1 ceramide glucosyltransferase [Melanaphis sacchari]XP_025196068.1 ceramide glucosyltransferase [Melanaphis sacchari]
MQLIPPLMFVDYDILLACGLLIFWCGYWLVHISAICYGKFKLYRKPKPESPVQSIPSLVSLEHGLPKNNKKQYPGVSILKPLLGVDPNLFVNLSSYFQMEYPMYEVLICVMDKNDPAAMVANRLLEMYPSVDARLFLGGSQVGVNPKINNVHAAYQAAKYSLILISDSSIKMKKDTLCDMVDNMADDVAIVHQVPFTCDRIDNRTESMTSPLSENTTDPSSFLKLDGKVEYQHQTRKQRRFIATLEKVFFGTAHARVYLMADLVGAICHTGMSTLLRKQAMDECGGLQAFASYLAEDYFMAKLVVARGWRTTISSRPALQNNGGIELSKFQDRLRRWVKLRIAMVPHTIILEPLSECLILGACAAWAANTLSGGSIDPYAFYMIHVLVWFLLDWILLNVMQNGPLPFTKFEYLVAWLYREFMGPYLFFTALLWRPSVVTWTTRQYRLRWGGLSEIYNQQSISSSSDSITATVPIATTTTVTYDTTVPNNYCSTHQQQPPNGIGFTSKIKV